MMIWLIHFGEIKFCEKKNIINSIIEFVLLTYKNISHTHVPILKLARKRLFWKKLLQCVDRGTKSGKNTRNEEKNLSILITNHTPSELITMQHTLHLPGNSKIRALLFKNMRFQTPHNFFVSIHGDLLLPLINSNCHLVDFKTTLPYPDPKAVHHGVYTHRGLQYLEPPGPKTWSSGLHKTFS